MEDQELYEASNGGVISFGEDDEREIWLEQDNNDMLAAAADVNIINRSPAAADASGSTFYDCDFPPLPDFSCMSSSSSSSSSAAPKAAPPAPKSVACSKTSAASSASSSLSSSSSSSSWAVLKSDAEEDVEKRYGRHQHHQMEQPVLQVDLSPSVGSTEMPPPPPLPLPAEDGGFDVDCMDVMEDFGYMDLLASNDICSWDPSLQQQQPKNDTLGFQEEMLPLEQEPHALREEEEEEEEEASEDLAMVFLEWLKSNKESISAEDLRRIKLRRETIECAAKRLGGGREGMKQLLKLILEWVQQNQLHRKPVNMNHELPSLTSNSHHHYSPDQNPNPNFNCNTAVSPDSNPPCYPTTSSWTNHHPHYYNFASDPMMAYTSLLLPQPPQPIPVSMGDPTFCQPSSTPNDANAHPYQSSSEYPRLDSGTAAALCWPASQFARYCSFPDSSSLALTPAACAGHGSQYPYHQHHHPQFYHHGQGGEGLVRLGSSATKEARKKRMARQRRVFSHQHHHHQRSHHSQQSQQNQNNMAADQHATLGTDSSCPQANPAANWVYWSPAAASPQPILMPDAPPRTDRQASLPVESYQRQFTAERRQVG